jgi:hypothetical protein
MAFRSYASATPLRPPSTTKFRRLPLDLLEVADASVRDFRQPDRERGRMVVLRDAVLLDVTVEVGEAHHARKRSPCSATPSRWYIPNSSTHHQAPESRSADPPRVRVRVKADEGCLPEFAAHLLAVLLATASGAAGADGCKYDTRDKCGC